MSDRKEILILNKSNFETTIKSGVTVVDFHAEWCGPCKAYAPVYDEIAVALENIATVAKADIDQMPEITSSYDIVSVPTLCFFKNGELVDKVSGMASKDSVINIVNKHIN